MRTPHEHRSLARRSGAGLSAVAAGLLLLAACGSGGGTSSAGGSPTSSSAATTVTVSNAGGMSVLATSSGRTLYSSAQEKGKVLCTSGACNAIWTPLTVSAGQQPTGPGGVASDLTTMKRPDGTRQVSFNGQPLYTFSFDHAAGQANGNGQNDRFDGTSFTWHVVTTSASPSSPQTSSGSSSQGRSYGY